MRHRAISSEISWNSYPTNCPRAFGLDAPHRQSGKTIGLLEGDCLSRGGRLVLVNAVISSLPLYHMSFYILPSWVINRIDQIRRAFLWKGGKTSHGISSLVKWEEVCKPRQMGGLGILDLRVFNTALLAKWWWQLIKEPYRPWASLILNLSCRHQHIWSFSPSNAPTSPFWKGITKAGRAFGFGAKIICGNGIGVRFWKDFWIGDKPLAIAYPSLFEIALDKDCMVDSQIEDGRWVLSFRILLSQTRMQALGSFLNTLSAHTFSQEKPTVLWTLDRSKIFSVNSLYKAIKGEGHVDAGANTIWAGKYPLKVRFTI